MITAKYNKKTEQIEVELTPMDADILIQWLGRNTELPMRSDKGLPDFRREPLDLYDELVSVKSRLA